MLATVTAMRHAGYALALGASLAGGSAGCGGHHDPEPEPQPDPLAPTPLLVTNATWLDVAIYVLHDGEMSRLSTVTAASSANVLIPPWMLQHSHAVRLFAHPVGTTGSINTDFIHVLPGQFVEWRLESNMERSSVAVY